MSKSRHRNDESSALDASDTAAAHFEQAMAAGHEMEIDIPDRLPIHAHSTLTDQTARLVGGRDKLQLFH